GVADPMARADVAEAFRHRVVDGGVAIAAVAEIGASKRFDAAVSVANEDAIGVENLHAEVVLELAKESEHAIDRAAGRFAALVDRDGEKAAFDELARRRHGSAVRGPFVEERIDLLQHSPALRFIERGRNAEQPDAGSGRKRIDINSRHDFKG